MRNAESMNMKTNTNTNTMNATPSRPTPETDAAWASWPYAGPGVHANFARELERERDEAREELQQWKMLHAWGGTPEHIDQFIRGQQSRIHEAQEIELVCEQLERERDEAREQNQAMREAIKEAHEALKELRSFYIEMTNLPPCAANAVLIKLQPFIAP